jgi:outer membrane protein OmpA-like peptidoglycan-associated protein
VATRPPAPATQEERQLAHADLSTLRSIVLGSDRELLEELSRRIRERQLRADDVADVLPEAFTREFLRAPARLKAAVRGTIEETLRESVHDDPRPIANAIFPVIGPAIRRYVTSSIRALAESLSRTIERGLSPRRQLAWRYRAWRSGISFGDYVLQRTFVYRVEHAYLIQAESGLLMGEAHLDEGTAMDSDAISGMLSALQSFVLDSFALEEGGQLRTADLGEYTLWAVHGPYAMLACAIRGTPGGELRQRLEASLDRIHLHYGRHLQRFDGDRDELPPALEEELENCLFRRHADDIDSARPRVGWQAWLVIVLLAGLVLRAIGGQVEAALAQGRLERVLANTPGIVLTAIERERGRFAVHGLRDPLAPPLADLAADARLSVGRAIDRFSPYQSLDTSLVLRRLDRALGRPDSVQWQLDGAVLRVSGTADGDWVTRLSTVPLLSPAIERIDTRALRITDAALLAAARQLLSPPAGVALQVRDGVLSGTGLAPLRWVEGAAQRVADLTGLQGVDFSAIRSVERDQARGLIMQIVDRHLLFERGKTEYAGDAEERLRGAAQDLSELGRLADSLGRELQVEIVGYTDGAGGERVNAGLRRARAERVRDDLIGRGVVPAQLVVLTAPPKEEDDPGYRRVVLRPRLTPGLEPDAGGPRP